jgi:hypothetical protein
MKTKKNIIATIFIYFLVISCSNEIKPSGKYIVGKNSQKEYIFEFKENDSVVIIPNNIQKISSLCSAVTRKTDLYGNLTNTLIGHVDQSVVNDIKNKLLAIRNFNFNKENYTTQELNDYLIICNKLIIDFNFLSTKYPVLDSNENFWKLEMECLSAENQILSAKTILEKSNCISIGKWDTNSNGDITISNLTQTKCDKIMEFNTVFFNTNPNADAKGVTNYSNNDFIMKPLKGLY